MNKLGLRDALQGGAIAGAATVPMNMMAGQGLGQSLINGILAGAGAGLGGTVGYMATPAGMSNTIPAAAAGMAGLYGGTTLGNQVGSDRNERAVSALGQRLYTEQLANDEAALYAAMDAELIRQALEMLPDSKREKLNESFALTQAQLQPQIQMVQSSYLPSEQMPNEKEMMLAQQVLDAAIANGQIQVV